MQNHNILGKKAVANAALKEKFITVIAWIFIAFCLSLVIYLSKVGLQSLFLTSNKQFTLQHLDISALNVLDEKIGLTNPTELEKALNLNIGQDNIFDIDLKIVRQTLLDKVAVKSADVSYLYPDTIRIRYAEETPVARLSHSGSRVLNFISLNALVLPPDRQGSKLPIITDYRKKGKDRFNVGNTIEDEGIVIPLKVIKLQDKRLEHSSALYILGHKEFAIRELIKINSIHFEKPNTLSIRLRAVPEAKVLNNCLLKLNADKFQNGLRRACIAILENAIVRRQTREIDARYSNTPTR
ncbi:MAG: FtsQ-type POTRA domain-containing protein [Lentisphaeraceae bacterium]|nr:FtsQ-type POTRA domain-containing protein [Lentisphaeraceae bacterium]